MADKVVHSPDWGNAMIAPGEPVVVMANCKCGGNCAWSTSVHEMFQEGVDGVNREASVSKGVREGMDGPWVPVT